MEVETLVKPVFMSCSLAAMASNCFFPSLQCFTNKALKPLALETKQQRGAHKEHGKGFY